MDPASKRRRRGSNSDTVNNVASVSDATIVNDVANVNGRAVAEVIVEPVASVKCKTLDSLPNLAIAHIADYLSADDVINFSHSK